MNEERTTICVTKRYFRAPRFNLKQDRAPLGNVCPVLFSTRYQFRTSSALIIISEQNRGRSQDVHQIMNNGGQLDYVFLFKCASVIRNKSSYANNVRHCRTDVNNGGNYPRGVRVLCFTFKNSFRAMYTSVCEHVFPFTVYGVSGSLSGRVGVQLTLK